MTTHRSIIEAWPSIAAFADDLRVGESHARVMKARNRIPAKFWVTVINKAAERKIKNVSLAHLMGDPKPKGPALKSAGATIPANAPQSNVTQS